LSGCEIMRELKLSIKIILVSGSHLINLL